MPESTAPLRPRRSFRAPVVVDVDERQELSADPVSDFTQAVSLETAPTPVSRRAALDAERTRGGRRQRETRAVRKRVVVKPTRVDRRAVAAARADAARAEAALVAGPSVANPRHPGHPRRGIFRRLHVGDRRRWGFHTFVLVALTAFFGTAALPSYASTGEASIAGNARTALAVQTLTAGNTAAQVVSREGTSIEESPENLDSTTGDTVSPTVQALAVQLMGAVASGRLVGSTPNHIPEIANLAEGKVVPDCGVDFRVLQAISVALDNFSQVGVSDINRRCTGQIEGAGTASAHYVDGGGHAVDFYLLNGSPLTGGDAQSLKLIELLDPIVPHGTDLGQVECRASIDLENFQPFSDTCNHLHIDFMKSDGATLRYG